MKIETPNSVKLIISELERNGFEAYAVGGCVRDALLGLEPNDWDITTSAMPEDVKRIFYKTFDTGIKHGTITVLIDHVGYEVTTYRIDGEYKDGRHPDSVEFTSNLEEDLKRRDFTINAMAYSDTQGVVDLFDGKEDLKNRIIRCVGIPDDRFTEDALRILRAVRFAASLDFEIEENTRKAIVALADNLKLISKERIQAELEKLLMSSHPEKIIIAQETGITRVILPYVDDIKAQDMLLPTMNFVKDCPKSHYCRWTAFLCHLDNEEATKILRELKFDNKTINNVSRLVMALKKPLPENKAELRHHIYEIGEDIFPDYISLIETLAGHKQDYPFEFDTVSVQHIKALYEEVMEFHECVSLKTLAVNGNDLISAGINPGSQVGVILDSLLMLVLDDSSLNTKDYLLSVVYTLTK